MDFMDYNKIFNSKIDKQYSLTFKKRKHHIAFILSKSKFLSF